MSISNSVRRPKVELSDEAKGAVSVLKGLVSSRKRITTLTVLEKEYKDLEGQTILFSKWGFSTLIDFLRSSGEFHISKNNEEVSEIEIETRYSIYSK